MGNWYTRDLQRKLNYAPTMHELLSFSFSFSYSVNFNFNCQMDSNSNCSLESNSRSNKYLSMHEWAPEWLTEWSPEWLSDRRGQLLPLLKSGAATFVRSPALRTDVDQWLQDCVWRRRLWESVRWRGANLTSTSALFPLRTGFATGIRYSIRYACDTFNSLWSTIKIARLSAGVNIGSPARGVAQAPRRGRSKTVFPNIQLFVNWIQLFRTDLVGKFCSKTSPRSFWLCHSSFLLR